MLVEPARLGRPLHLDDADAGPEKVHETAIGELLEPRSLCTAICAVALEQPVQEGLCFAALRSRVAAPGSSELAEPPADLLARQGHGGY